MMTARELARALGGEVTGKQVICPGPGHSTRDRSLSVTPSPSAPDGFICHSHAGDDWQSCRDYVRAKLGLPEWQPGDEQDRRITRTREFDRMAIEAEDRQRTEDDVIRIQRAAKLWSEAHDPRGTAAEAYLKSRALDLPPNLAATVLRFHPRCPWRNENTGRMERIPALLAVFRSIDDDEITAVHRVRLDQPQRWPKTDRRMLGVVRRSAIKLDPIGPKLTIGEGIETCMAARQLGLAPAWALGSVGAISFFPVIDSVKNLTVLGETGPANAEAVKLVTRRWQGAWRKVQIAYSEVGDDINDALMMDIAK